MAAKVAGHHDDRVAEIHGAALTIGETAIVEHLQQDVEHIRMRFFHFIQQDHAIRAAAHGLGQIAAFFIPHIAGRRADQPADAVLFHELAHVDAHHRIAGVEQEVGQRLAQLGLAHAGRAEEQE